MKDRKPPNNKYWYKLRDISIFNENILVQYDDFSTYCPNKKGFQISKYQSYSTFVVVISTP